ncbi:mitochondrial inner membrane protein-domain-containing protein [Flagelloscypha sp. PMI_526]|nr:mitochondrial inner membrane protein-domain-containing protein [Flagelloscypha sp. PMI_526]
MHQALLVASRNAGVRPSSVVRVVRRRLATSKPDPKRRFTFTRIVFTTFLATGSFYAGSLFLSFKSPDYYDWFSDNVPLGQPLIEFGEARKWDSYVTSNAPSKPAAQDVKSAVEKKITQTKATVEKTASDVKAVVAKQAEKVVPSAKPPTPTKSQEAEVKAKQAADSAREKLKKTVSQKLDKAKEKLDSASDKARAGWIARHQAGQLADEVADLRAQAEAALRGDYPDSVKQLASEVKEKVEAVAPLLPSTPSQPVTLLPNLLVLLVQLPAPTPNTSLRADPTPLPGSIPYTNIPSSSPKAEPPSALDLEKQLKAAEALLDEQVREHTLKLIEFEMTAQDALDKQEADFKRALMSEREKISQVYRQKMEEELQVQRDLIEERLKETLAAQSVELQRRWIREIKVLVEQERGGRLSKITEIQTKLKALESVALDNAAVLDDAARSKALIGAVDVFKQASLFSVTKKGFRDELRTLRALALESKDDLLTSALDSLDKSDTPDVGVEPLPDLTAWFTTSVSPKAARMALALSVVTFRRLDEGQLKNRADGGGDDVLSTLSRTEWYLKMDGLEGLERATRELNQLPLGPSRAICEDWLSEARRRLEVGMLVETLESLATVKALLYSA